AAPTTSGQVPLFPADAPRVLRVHRARSSPVFWRSIPVRQSFLHFLVVFLSAHGYVRSVLLQNHIAERVSSPFFRLCLECPECYLPRLPKGPRCRSPAIRLLFPIFPKFRKHPKLQHHCPSGPVYK